MTDIFEGSIIRSFRRLQELLRQMGGAARAIGNDDLETKFDDAIKLLERPNTVVFNPSYVDARRHVYFVILANPVFSFLQVVSVNVDLVDSSFSLGYCTYWGKHVNMSCIWPLCMRIYVPLSVT